MLGSKDNVALRTGIGTSCKVLMLDLYGGIGDPQQLPQTREKAKSGHEGTRGGQQAA